MAVTAIICANTSEVALLAASFMQFSLDSGLGGTRILDAIHRGPRRLDDRQILRGTPLDGYSL
jgi:hypothetical protein